MATAARLRANEKYRLEHYKQLSIKASPELIGAWQRAAAAAGQSTRAYIMQAVQERMARDAAQAASAGQVHAWQVQQTGNDPSCEG